MNLPAPLLAAMNLVHGGNLDGAESAVRAFLRRQPRNPQASNLLAMILTKRGRFAEAEFFARHAADAEPRNPDYRNGLGVVLVHLGKHEAAAAIFGSLAKEFPSRAAIESNFGNALMHGGRPVEAEEAFRRALKADPNHGDTLRRYGTLMLQGGRVDLAHPMLERAWAASPAEPGLCWSCANLTNYIPDCTPEAVRAAHERAGSVLAPTREKRAFEGPLDRSADRPLRIGWLSPDLRDHSVARFFAPLLENLNAAMFPSFCYHASPISDAMTARLRGWSAGWRDVFGSTDQDLARMIREDRIDILIDLAGLSVHSRVFVAALRPAPITATYLGYPATTGLSCVDERIVDHTTDPNDGLAERAMTEAPRRMAGCFLCYRPPEDAPPVAPLPDGPPVFVSFNQAKKLNPRVADLWARIMRRVPESRLLLRVFGGDESWIRANIRALFGGRGVDEGRIELSDFAARRSDHLSEYGRAAIALDTFPYNGTTTTCEALHMGVPVVTFPGTLHAARVGASLLRACGTPELIAAGPQEYEDLAVALATDPARLRRYRAELRGTLAASSLCDGPGFARRFEACLREMWIARVASGS